MDPPPADRRFKWTFPPSAADRSSICWWRRVGCLSSANGPLGGRWAEVTAWMVAGDPSAAGTHAEGDSCHVFMKSCLCLSTCLHSRLLRLTLKLVTVGPETHKGRNTWPFSWRALAMVAPRVQTGPCISWRSCSFYTSLSVLSVGAVKTRQGNILHTMTP